MDTAGGGEGMCWRVGEAGQRSMGERGDLCSTLNNKNFK